MHFPDHTDGRAQYLIKVERAKTFCRANCPVLNQCLESALARGEQHGVWGGELFDMGRAAQRIRVRQIREIA